MPGPLPLIAAALLAIQASAESAALSLRSDFPGGNIVLEKIEGDEVCVHQDLRDTEGDWFYWCFRVEGAPGRRLTFHFTGSKAIGPLGPAVSRDDGRTWQWLGHRESATAFRYAFGPGETRVTFCFGMSYLEQDLRRFLQKYQGHPALGQDVLAQTRKGRPVQRLTLGCLADNPRFKVLVTCRHHACEMMASYATEGLLEAVLADTADGAWLRAQVQFVVIPFVDKDGVEEGDQGKNRRPHDHKADYRGASIYPEVAALRAFVERWAGGEPDVDLDLHDPALNTTFIYCHALRTREGQADNSRDREKRFLDTLEAVQTGPLAFRTQDSVQFAAKMARKPETAVTYGDGEPAAPASGTQRHTLHAGFEIPYALVGDVPVTPESARAFGRDLARALAVYLQAAR
jgi:hypothetical protein